MNVKCIIVNLDAPSTRVRILNLIPFLQKQGIHLEVLLLPTNLLARIRLFRSLATVDVLILQKKMLNPIETWLLKRYVRCLVFDYDDAVFFRDGCTNEKDSFSFVRSHRFFWTVHNAELLIAGNPYLAEHTRRLLPPGKQIEVLPSAVPVTGVPVRNWNEKNPLPVIGWVGTAGGFRFLRQVAPVLAEISREYPFVFQVVCNQDFSWPGINIQNLPWSEAMQEQLICRFDIGIMPLDDSPWTRGKCSYKLLQYMAAGIPFVASAVGMNVVLGRNNEAGLVATTNEEFRDALRALLHDPERCAQMGRCGRQMVEADYSIEIVSDRLSKMLYKAATRQ